MLIPPAPLGFAKMLDVQSEAPSDASARTAFSFAATTREVGQSFQDRLKRAADLVLAAGLLLFTLPLCGFLCLALKLDSSGPIFSQQPRLNHAGRRYAVLRFRTPETALGGFLRYTRIEDLPQLINVLRGEMTLMGLDGKPYALDD